MQKIPANFHVLFWDTKVENLNFDAHKQYIIERVLEYGDFSADRWLSSLYSDPEIIDVVKKSKRISIKTANLYSIKYNIKKEEIECFRNPYTQKQNRF